MLGYVPHNNIIRNAPIQHDNIFDMIYKRSVFRTSFFRRISKINGFFFLRPVQLFFFFTYRSSKNNRLRYNNIL